MSFIGLFNGFFYYLFDRSFLCSFFNNNLLDDIFLDDILTEHRAYAFLVDLPKNTVVITSKALSMNVTHFS